MLLLMMMMTLLQLHAVNDGDIDDEKKIRWFIDAPVSVPDADDDVVLDHVSIIHFLVKGEC
jgi:hypothetical protein